jgi:5-methylcytosine-specific restriction endonuclease McrA
MTEIESRGWTQVGAKELFHYCGARIRKPSGEKLWFALTVAGASVPGFSHAALAIEWLETNDPDFWSYGQLSMSACPAGIVFSFGPFDSAMVETLVVCSVPDGTDFPVHLQSAFKRHVLGKATCAKCGGQSTIIQLRRLTCFDRTKEYRDHYVVCTCGHPVWRMALSDSFLAHREIQRTEYSWQRKLSLAEAGGKHSNKEMDEIRLLQENRCIYCNALFTEALRPTEDHLAPITHGGGDWSLNIVLACRSCNSRRGNVPFRTYCKLLSKLQNQRIISHLARRLCARDLANLSEEELDAFFYGIALHDPRNSRYLKILDRSAIARKNAAMNRVMPGDPQLFLKMVFSSELASTERRIAALEKRLKERRLKRS